MNISIDTLQGAFGALFLIFCKVLYDHKTDLDHCFSKIRVLEKVVETQGEEIKMLREKNEQSL